MALSDASPALPPTNQVNESTSNAGNPSLNPSVVRPIYESTVSILIFCVVRKSLSLFLMCS